MNSQHACGLLQIELPRGYEWGSDSGSGSYPCQSNDACFWRNPLSQAGRNLINRHRFCAIGQRHPPPGSTEFLRREAD